MPTFIIANDADLTRPICLNAEDARHLTRVMRVKPGETIRVTNNAGKFARCRVTSTTPLALAVIATGDGAPPFPAVMCLPLIEHSRLEWAVEKLAELNIKAVQLTVTERTQQRGLSRAKLTRLEKIALSAQKQCGRCWPMGILKPLPLDVILATPNIQGIVAVLPPHLHIGTSAPRYVGTNPPPTLALRHIGTIPQPTSAPRHLSTSTHLFIGPEGGWSPREAKLFQERAIPAVSFGPTVLRTETAALITAHDFWHGLN